MSPFHSSRSLACLLIQLFAILRNCQLLSSEPNVCRQEIWRTLILRDSIFVSEPENSGL